MARQNEDEKRKPDPASRSDLDESGGRRGAFQRATRPDGGVENSRGVPGGGKKIETPRGEHRRKAPE
ncbi:MAG: hypothetical protein AB7M12_10130 [Hyphomonadaceae bacterium]